MPIAALCYCQGVGPTHPWDIHPTSRARVPSSTGRSRPVDFPQDTAQAAEVAGTAAGWDCRLGGQAWLVWVPSGETQEHTHTRWVWCEWCVWCCWARWLAAGLRARRCGCEREDELGGARRAVLPGGWLAGWQWLDDNKSRWSRMNAMARNLEGNMAATQQTRQAAKPRLAPKKSPWAGLQT